MTNPSQFKGKKLKQITLAGPIHTPDSGQLKNVILANDTPTQRGVDMVLDDNFVILTVKNKLKPKPETILVPLSYCSHLVLDEV